MIHIHNCKDNTKQLAKENILIWWVDVREWRKFKKREPTNHGQDTGKVSNVSRETRNTVRILMDKHLVKHMRDWVRWIDF